MFQMTTSWCAPLYKKLGYNDTILDKCLPVKNFVNEVITGTSPHAEGNFLERHKEEIRKAKPGSRYVRNYELDNCNWWYDHTGGPHFGHIWHGWFHI